jgi:hypothetical protein
MQLSRSSVIIVMIQAPPEDTGLDICYSFADDEGNMSGAMCKMYAVEKMVSSE